jgi:hypothetical protein
MNNDRSRELLYDYARGRLSEQDRSEIEEQLQSSEELRTELEKVKTYYAAIHEMDPVPVPKRFLDKVHLRIDSKGKRSLLNRLLYPLHLKLPIEFAGVAATVVLVIFVFFPQLEKKNFTEYEPVPSDDVPQVSPSLQDEIAGKPVTAITEIKETANSKLINPAEKSSVQKVERPLPVAVQQLKSSAPKPLKESSMASEGAKMADHVSSIPASAQPPIASAPEPELVPAPVQQTFAGNDEVNKSEQASATAPAAQEERQQIAYSKSEELASVSKRSTASFEKKRMRFRSEKTEKYDEKEMASSMDLEMTPVKEDIPELLAKCGMKWVVKESTEYTTTCRASGTPKSVTRFLREINRLPEVTLLKTMPENYSTKLDSVIVEFSVNGKVE